MFFTNRTTCPSSLICIDPPPMLPMCRATHPQCPFNTRAERNVPARAVVCNLRFTLVSAEICPRRLEEPLVKAGVFGELGVERTDKDVPLTTDHGANLAAMF